MPAARRRRPMATGTQGHQSGLETVADMPAIPGVESASQSPSRESAHDQRQVPYKTRGGREVKKPKRLGVD